MSIFKIMKRQKNKQIVSTLLAEELQAKPEKKEVDGDVVIARKVELMIRLGLI